MQFFNTISNWKDERYEKYKARMKSQGNCPDCCGRGLIPSTSALSTLHIAPYDCPGCNGSGLYSDWLETHE